MNDDNTECSAAPVQNVPNPKEAISCLAGFLPFNELEYRFETIFLKQKSFDKNLLVSLLLWMWIAVRVVYSRLL